MSLDDFRIQILKPILDDNDSVRKQAEENFYALLNENPCIVLQLLVENSNSNDSSNSRSITLLGRTASLISDKFIEIGDSEFHQEFQSSLLSLLQNTKLSSNLLSNISFIISVYSKIYNTAWSSLTENLFQIIQNSEQPSYAIDCLTYCISNKSIICNEQILDIINQLIQSVFDSIEVLVPQFFSAMKLVFVLYRSDAIDESFKSNLKVYSDKIVGVNYESSEKTLHDNFMIELSNFTDDNIDFFESSLVNLTDMLGSKLCSQSYSSVVENQAILILKDIFCNKKYLNEFGEKSMEIYDLLVKIISSKLSETEINPDEEGSAPDESNTISNAEDAINSIAHNYGGFDEVSTYLVSSFGGQQPEEPEIFIANFISFGCVIKEIIDFIDPETFLPYIMPIYKIGFSSESVDCRYRSIVSLKKVIKALDDYRDFDWNSQEIIELIFETLSKESALINVTSLLKALKAVLFTFKDYHNNIENIIIPLEQNFESFTNKQQSIVIICYACCCRICEDENDQNQELMQNILSRIVSILNEGPPNLSDELFFACLDSVLDFDSFAPPNYFEEISTLVIKFISTFDGSEVSMIDVLSYKQIDIVNRTLRGLISICPKQSVLDFASQVLNPLLSLALNDIKPQSHDFDESKSELQTNNEVIRNSEENCWICYPKDSIYKVSEALHSIQLILEKCPEIPDSLLQQIINIIEKYTDNCFSFTLVQKCAQILLVLLKKNPKMKLQEMEPFLLNSLLAIMSAFDLINDRFEESSEDTISLIRLFIQIFDFIGENFKSPNSLSVVIGADENKPNPIDLIFKLHSKWSKLHQVGFSSSEDKSINEFNSVCIDVETKIGKMFDPIFKHYSTAEVGEKIFPLLLQNFPIESPIEFITPTFFEAYSSLVVNFSLCSEEHISKICLFFSELLISAFTEFPSYVVENAAQSIMKITNSGKINLDMFTFLIEKIEEGTKIDKEKINLVVVPELLILIENVSKNRINLTLAESDKNAFLERLIQLFLINLPISYLKFDQQNAQLVDSFMLLLSINRQMMDDAHISALMCSLAFVFIFILKLSKQVMKQLKLFIKSVFSSEQGKAVYDEFQSLPLTKRFRKECLEYIQESNE